MTEPKEKDSKVDTNFFQRKVAGVPMWVIISAVGLLILGLVYYKRKSSAAASTADTTNTDQSATVPPFINQTYVQNFPPTSPPMPKHKPPVDDDKTRKIKLTVGMSLAQISKKYKISIKELEEINPHLKKYDKHIHARIPKGTTINLLKDTKKKDPT